MRSNQSDWQRSVCWFDSMRSVNGRGGIGRRIKGSCFRRSGSLNRFPFPIHVLLYVIDVVTEYFVCHLLLNEWKEEEITVRRQWRNSWRAFGSHFSFKRFKHNSTVFPKTVTAAHLFSSLWSNRVSVETAPVQMSFIISGECYQWLVQTLFLQVLQRLLHGRKIPTYYFREVSSVLRRWVFREWASL